MQDSWVQCIFGVSKQPTNWSQKITLFCAFAVSELLPSGTALKKGAVCLAFRDPNQAVNASKIPNKHQDSFWLVQVYSATLGERKSGIVSLDNETHKFLGQFHLDHRQLNWASTCCGFLRIKCVSLIKFSNSSFLATHPIFQRACSLGVLGLGG